MIKDILTAAGVLHKQGRFPKPPADTYAVYFDDVEKAGADRVPLVAGKRLPGVRHHDVTVEVYEPKPDDKTEATIEAELDTRGLEWSKQDRYWLQDVQRYQVIYEFSMAKRTKETITLGSGKIYLKAFAEAMPTVEELCVESNLLGHIKGGASLEYTEETYEEKDDLGYVLKIITTSEEAILKCGLLTWNGETLSKLIDRYKTTEASGKRTTKIGGAGNAQGGYYAICFMHEDKTDGNVWIMIKGRNTAGATLTFAADEGTVIEPEFKAMPHDNAGTLIEFIEEIPAA